MLADEKILVTGVTGMVAAPIATFLAEHNEVWGLARFTTASERTEALNTNPLSRQVIEAHGVKTCAVDPRRTRPFRGARRLHLRAAPRAHASPADIDMAVHVNAIGAGRVLQHCRRAKAALVMSSHAVYSPPSDPFHPSRETDDLGKAVTPCPSSRLG